MASEAYTIASVDIDGQDLFNKAFNRKRLAEGLKNADGTPNQESTLLKLLEFVKSEDRASFDKSRVKFGDNDSKYFFSYYSNGMLYRIMKNGTVKMESADIDEDMGRQVGEFNKLVKMCLVSELSNRLISALNEGDGAKVRRKKEISPDANGSYVAVALSVSD